MCKVLSVCWDNRWPNRLSILLFKIAKSCFVPGLLREMLSQIERTVQIFEIFIRELEYKLLKTRMYQKFSHQNSSPLLKFIIHFHHLTSLLHSFASLNKHAN